MRALMVGGGRRALALAEVLLAEDHAVRYVTRDPARCAEIEAAGCECWVGDADRIGSLRYALDNVTVVLWLLGAASGPDPEQLRALHGSRLTMMLERVTDSTTRGLLYEAAGPVGADVLAAGEAEVRRMTTLNEIPLRVLRTDPADVDAWVAEAKAAIDDVLTAARSAPA